jgi:hypothetical protein
MKRRALRYGVQRPEARRVGIGDLDSLGIGDLDSLGIGDLDSLGIGDLDSLGIGDLDLLGIGDLDLLGIGDLDLLGIGDAGSSPPHVAMKDAVSNTILVEAYACWLPVVRKLADIAGTGPAKRQFDTNTVPARK